MAIGKLEPHFLDAVSIKIKKKNEIEKSYSHVFKTRQ